ncbi:MAG: hypothetical protein QNJ34_21485 [Xenococcaceae cyanobacterium MO_188.B29]|nr:hypothetical protein [Xenococcaceae cyanobacterium MO_188.B29]
MTANTSKTIWQYLESRPESWRKQLYLKGRKLTAHTVWSDMIVNSMTPAEVADSKDLPLSAVNEAIEYCENNQQLLQQEAEAERFCLEERGVILEPKITH